MSPGISVASQNDEIGAVVSVSQEVNNGTIPAITEQVRVSAMVLDEAISPTRSTIGITLTFFQTLVVNWVKYAKIKSKDVQPEIEF